MKFICVGYPDEENCYHGHHTEVEEWECEATMRTKHMLWLVDISTTSTKFRGLRKIICKPATFWWTLCII